jgi:hypothetical protein
MKKLNLLMGLTSLALVGFFTSCSSDKTALGPSLEITSGEKDTVPANSVLTISWRANAGDVNLKSFTIKEGNAAITDKDAKSWNAADIPSANNEAYVGSARVGIGAVATSFELIVTDKDGLTASKTVSVAIESTGPVGTLKAEKSIVLGAQDNATGSFFASLTGDIWTITQLKSGSHFNQVDLIYYVGATNKEAIFSPKAIVDNNITWSSAVSIASWGTPNATKFKLAATADYDNATFASVQTLGTGAALDLANGGDTPIVGLKTGDVYSFKTAGGKYGVFKVSAVTAGATNTITLVVKVQE